MAGMQFGGEEVFAASQETVYAMLVDLDALAEGIPDVVSSERIDDRSLRAVVRPGFSFLRGTMKLKIELAELAPPTSALMRCSKDPRSRPSRIRSRAAPGAGR